MKVVDSLLATLLIASVGLTFAPQGVTGGSLVVLPKQAVISLPEGRYLVQVCDGKCTGLQVIGGKATIVTVDGSSTCPVDENTPGVIHVESGPIPVQRKILTHEVVHIAIKCDKRNEPLDERIAEDISSLFDSELSRFMIGR